MNADWIPCKEQMPAKWLPVIVSINGSDIIVPRPGESLEEAAERLRKELVRVDLGMLTDEGWVGPDGWPMIIAPTAWMKLPEPYREEPPAACTGDACPISGNRCRCPKGE